MGSWEDKKNCILWKENLAVWGCVWMMSHPTFILCPSETCYSVSPFVCVAFSAAQTAKGNIVQDRKIWYETPNPWDVRGPKQCTELLWTLFSICKVSSWRQFKQGAAAWPLWIISLLWEYSQFLSNLSIKKFILVIQVRLVLLRCHENITGTIQRCQSIYLAPSQDSCHSS